MEASEWIAKLDVRRPSRGLQARFERWRSESPRHEAAYLRLAAVWGRLDRLALGDRRRGTSPVARTMLRLTRG
ncbi:MAG: FecR/PupR family sigma factor regulator [Steroidobacteraceae bacterium]